MEPLTHAPVPARFGYAVSDPTRAKVLRALSDTPAHPSDLADSLGLSRQSMSNHLTWLRGRGLMVGVPDGRHTRYELADARLGPAIRALIWVVPAVDPGLLRTRWNVHGMTAALELEPTTARRAVLSRRIRPSAAALSCRVYPTDHGLTGLPSDEPLRAAVHGLGDA